MNNLSKVISDSKQSLNQMSFKGTNMQTEDDDQVTSYMYSVKDHHRVKGIINKQMSFKGRGSTIREM